MAESVIPLRVIEDRMRVIEEQITLLNTEREMLLALTRQAVAIQRAGEATEFQITALPTLTDTIAQFVREHPGMTSGAIADAFAESNLVVGGSDPRKTVLTTVAALVQKRRLRRDESTGGHFTA